MLHLGQALEAADPKSQRPMPMRFDNDGVVSLGHSESIEDRQIHFALKSKVALVLDVEDVGFMVCSASVGGGLGGCASLLERFCRFGMRNIRNEQN